MQSFYEWIVGEKASELSSLAFELNSPFGIGMTLLSLLLLTAFIGLWYFPKLNKMPSWDRWATLLIRGLTLYILLFLLLDPKIIGYHMTPNDQQIIVLYDDSKSMQITNENGHSRGELLKQALDDLEPALIKQLENKYFVRQYRFGEFSERIPSHTHLTFEQTQSDILGAIEHVTQEWKVEDLRAMIIFSDGIQQPEQIITESIQSIAFDVPIYTVGTGESSQWRDVSIDKLSVKRTHFDQSPIVVNTDIKGVGIAGFQAQIDLLEANQVVKSETIRFENDYEIKPVQLKFVPTLDGWIDCSLRVRLQEQYMLDQAQEVPDRIVENNVKNFVVDNTTKDYRILYVSGRPNWEQKFVARALGSDEQLNLTRLIRISSAEQKFEYRGAKTTTTNPLFDGFENNEEEYGRYDESIFLRIGADESELMSGFPTDEQELYNYDLLILGDAERQMFTLKQLELIREFVSKRGGTLLMMGGPRAFQHGGYQGSPIEAILPVVMKQEDDYQEQAQRPFLVLPTLEGDIYGAWSLEENRTLSQQKWGDMPLLFGLNEFAFTRAGASIWLRSLQQDEQLHDQAVFAIQRYGAGHGAIMATGETWPWHMQNEEERSPHQRVWRQLIRSLVTDVPDQIQLRAKKDVYPVGLPINLETLIRDAAYNPSEAQRVFATVRMPSGHDMTLPVDESIEEPGVYWSEFVPQETGIYHVLVEVKDEQNNLITELNDALLVEPNHQEWSQPEYQPAFLSELSDRTKGDFFELNQVASLAKTIEWVPDEKAEKIEIKLWHLHLFFWLIPLLMVIEWFLRRRRGLA